jgi:hypothetical protein
MLPRPNSLRLPTHSIGWLVLAGGVAILVASESWRRRHKLALIVRRTAERLKGSGLSASQIQQHFSQSGVASIVEEYLENGTQTGVTTSWKDALHWHVGNWSFLALSTPRGIALTLVVGVNHRSIPRLVRAALVSEKTGQTLASWDSYSGDTDQARPHDAANVTQATVYG